jgi:hypothetical protein
MRFHTGLIIFFDFVCWSLLNAALFKDTTILPSCYFSIRDLLFVFNKNAYTYITKAIIFNIYHIISYDICRDLIIKWVQNYWEALNLHLWSD